MSEEARGSEETYTVVQAAKILRVTDRAVRKWLAEGSLEREQDSSGRWHVPHRAVHARLEGRPPRPQEEGPSESRGSPEMPPEMLEIVGDLERRLGEAQEEARRLREELEAERSRGFWRRLFGG